jgi:hypothetical protein
MPMDTPRPDRPLLTDILRHMDEARSARPRTLQKPSEIVRERNERLAIQAAKIEALRQAREAGQQLQPEKVKAWHGKES